MVPKPKNVGLSRPIFAHKPGEQLAMDFPGKELPITSLGYRFLLIVIDIFTRFPFVIPLRNKSVTEMADGLMAHVFSIMSLPILVHSDNE